MGEASVAKCRQVGGAGKSALLASMSLAQVPCLALSRRSFSVVDHGRFAVVGEKES